MDGAVPERPGMNFAAQRPPDHLVTRIDDVKIFLPHRKPLLCGAFVSIRPFSREIPMPKIDVSKVAEILKKNQIDPSVLRRVIEEMNLAVQPELGKEEKPPPVKKQFVVLVSDPEGRLPKNDFVGWVLQIPENESPATTPDRIFRSVYDYNTTKKGRLYPAKTVGEALENISAKNFKEADVWVKTKTPVLVLKTDNEIPKE